MCSLSICPALSLSRTHSDTHINLIRDKEPSFNFKEFAYAIHLCFYLYYFLLFSFHVFWVIVWLVGWVFVFLLKHFMHMFCHYPEVLFFFFFAFNPCIWKSVFYFINNRTSFLFLWFFVIPFIWGSLLWWYFLLLFHNFAVWAHSQQEFLTGVLTPSL